MGLIRNISEIAAKQNDTVDWASHVADFEIQWRHEAALNYFYAIVMLILAIFGTIGNLVVLISFFVVKELHRLQYAFVGNLAAADLLITAIVIPVNVFATIKGPYIFRDYPWFCELDGTICASACAGSIWCIMAISVERYICICHFPMYQKIFTPVGVVGMITFLWFVAHSIHLPNYLGWGATSYSADLYLCTAELHVWSYSVFYGASAILVPIGVSFFAYFRIYLRIRKSTAARKVIVVPAQSRISSTQPSGGNKPSGKGKQESADSAPVKVDALREEIQLVKALFKVFIMFLISWFPLGLFFVARSWIPFPKWYSYVGLIVAHGSSATNSVIYFWMTDLMRTTYEGYRRTCCGNRKRTRIFNSTVAETKSRTIEDNRSQKTVEASRADSKAV